MNMKNFIFSCLGAMFILISCEGSKAVIKEEVLMRGDWTISNVSISGINENLVKVTVLDEAEAKCFEGSNWHFVQNNASGNYQLNGGGNCPSGGANIKWFVTDENGQKYFNFKKVYQGEKPKNVLDGYKMRISSNTGNTIVLVQDLMFEGKPIQVNYIFEKL